MATIPRTSFSCGRALLAEAQAGNLPVEPVPLPDGCMLTDPNAAAQGFARLCRLAASVGRTEEAEGHARDLLALVARKRTVYHDPARNGLTYAEADTRLVVLNTRER